MYHSNELITLVTTAAADIAVQYVERTELHYGQYEMVIDLENPSTMQIKYAAVFMLYLHVNAQVAQYCCLQQTAHQHYLSLAPHYTK